MNKIKFNIELEDPQPLLEILRRTAAEQEQMIIDFQRELALLRNLIDQIEGRPVD